MLVQPDTLIRLIKNCPLDKNYQNTLYFTGAGKAFTLEESIKDGLSSQEHYFKNELEGITLTKQSYQRHSNNSITIIQNIGNIYDYNYLMFKNTSFENKWFYAFITNIEYVSNNVTRVEYEIDVMQTWLFNFELQPCFVEREHSLFDDVGFNKIEEDIKIGPYIYRQRDLLPCDYFEDLLFISGDTSLISMSVVFMLNPNSLFDFEDIVPNETRSMGVYSGVYQGLEFVCLRLNKENAGKIRQLLSDANFISGGGLASVFIMPTMFIPTEEDGDYNLYNKKYTAKVKIPTAIGSYVPKNKKLLTYPYNCAYLTNHRGNYVEVKFEYCDKNSDGTVNFCATGNFGSNCSVMVYPKNYQGIEDNIEYCVTIPSYPLCSWGNSGFLEWVINDSFNGIKGAINSIKGVGIASSQTGKKAALAMDTSYTSAAINAMSYAGEAVSSALHAGSITGSGNSDLAFGTQNGRNINVYYQQITPEYAAVIDSYFDKYGYACKQIKYPNISSRPYWNYVKTLDCYITGNLPSNAKDKICKIFDSGITFWKDHRYVGQYTNNNSPEF